MQWQGGGDGGMCQMFSEARNLSRPAAGGGQDWSASSLRNHSHGWGGGVKTVKEPTAGNAILIAQGYNLEQDP